jgi:hypothetical protein
VRAEIQVRHYAAKLNETLEMAVEAGMEEMSEELCHGRYGASISV